MKNISFLFLSFLLLSACNLNETTDPATTDTPESSVQVTTADFDDVCNGILQSKASAYTEEAGIHPVLLFDRDSQTDTYMEKSFFLPDSWQVSWEDAEKYQLVTCVTTEPKEVAEVCEFDIEEDAYTLNNYSANYTVGLYVAQTGAELAKTSFELPADDCPIVHYFSSKNEDNYPDYKQSLTEFLKPYVQK